MIEAISYALALALWAVVAWNLGRGWLDEQAKRRVTDERLKNLLAKQELQDDVVNKLAIDWRQKFNQLEQTMKNEFQARDRGGAGAVPLAPRGFNR